MNKFETVFVILLLVNAKEVSSLICETCDGNTCFDKDRWIQEMCPQSTQFCYRLSANGTIFRRGCSDYPCSLLPGVEPEMDCRVCSHDRCNNERDSFFRQHGGGVSWKNGVSHVFGFTSLVFSTVIVFIK